MKPVIAGRDEFGLDAYRELVDRDPDGWARRMMQSSNAMAHAEILRLAQAARESRVAEREQELDEREVELDERAGEDRRREE